MYIEFNLLEGPSLRRLVSAVNPSPSLPISSKKVNCYSCIDVCILLLEAGKVWMEEGEEEELV